MLRSVKELHDYSVVSNEEELGDVRDFHFDDRDWTIRYLEVDTGDWLPGRRVLVPPSALGQPDWTGRAFPVSLTKEQIQKSPMFTETDRIDRAREQQLYTYYGWQPYWAGGIMAQSSRAAIANALGSGRRTTTPMTEGSTKAGQMAEGHVRDSSLDDLSAADRPVSGPSRGMEGTTNPNDQPQAVPKEDIPAFLRSCKEAMGFHIQASDGEIGHVEDFIVDDENWSLRYVVVDTRNWLPGKKVLLASWWINTVDWDNEKVGVDLTKDTIKNSPEYDPSAPVNRQYEEVFFDYYGRPKYWL